MNKLHLLLLAALIGCSLLLVRTAYETRRLYTELDKAKGEQRKLDIEWKRLDAERQAQATHLRIERTAREKLAMRTADPAVTVYIDDRDAVAAPSLLPAPAAAPALPPTPPPTVVAGARP